MIMAPLNKVNHDFLYHCEIQYETKDGFDFKSAVGNSLDDLMRDIDLRFKELAAREPKIVQVLYDPLYESINITPKILSLIRLKAPYSSK